MRRLARTILLVLAASAALLAEAVEWRNVDAAHHIGGRKASAGYLQGKVVLVVRWGADTPSSGARLSQIEKLFWQSFKMKSFVVLASHCPGRGDVDAAKKIVGSTTVPYPVYEGAGLVSGEPLYKSLPFLYVVDETGRVIYRGGNEQDAIQRIVIALTDMDAPKDLAQWKRFLDYELEHLPARAYLRMEEFRKKFPKEAKDYEARFKELAKIPNVREASELLAFAKRAKDAPKFGPRERNKQRKYESLVNDILKKYQPLKEAADPRLQQEAKNALADLQWLSATF